MRIPLFLGTVMLSTPFIVSAAVAAEPATQTYLLRMKLQDGGRVIATPQLTVKAGEPARVEIGEADGGHYSVSLTASPRANATLGVTSAIDIVSATGVHRTANPALIVKTSQASAFEFGQDGQGQKPFRLDFTIDPVADQPN
ncbi:MAG: hypothetical protein JWN66_2019 [Sphingomonas bacterium]|jgi:hypothetical protein|uniref:hypothetical protein n=1 Tax=Sphingomonas bacterium TaxID=1895847 RepID=UPI002634BD76|nr:hypothetical protein [Sphingomonas bacterium]MDB5704903.1 hypothetical protein [Sphingomonas bacterium]